MNDEKEVMIRRAAKACRNAKIKMSGASEWFNWVPVFLDQLAEANEERQRHQVGESYQVGHEHGSAVAVKFKAERDELRTQLADTERLAKLDLDAMEYRYTQTAFRNGDLVHELLEVMAQRQAAEDERDRLQARIDVALAFHPDDLMGKCTVCCTEMLGGDAEDWPCPTVRALQGDTE